jgi:hypothetical protein
MHFTPHKSGRVAHSKVRVLCERAGLFAGIAAADHRMQSKLLATARRPVGFNFHAAFFASRVVLGRSQVEMRRSFVGRPSLRDGLRFLRMTSKTEASKSPALSHKTREGRATRRGTDISLRRSTSEDARAYIGRSAEVLRRQAIASRRPALSQDDIEKGGLLKVPPSRTKREKDGARTFAQSTVHARSLDSASGSLREPDAPLGMTVG